ncbi:MAG: sulfotransferase [Sedimenticola sp.]
MVSQEKSLPPVVIVGMHRSGTSSISGALCRMGWSAGEDASLFAADQFNVEGYYERLDVVTLNKKLLTQGAAGIAQSEGLREDYEAGWLLGAWKDCAGVGDQGEEIERCLAQVDMETRGNGSYLLKDPRLSLTYSHWKEFLPRHGVVLMIRHPGAVARSMLAKDGLPLELAFALWVKYAQNSLRHMGNNPLVVVYEDLLRQPGEVLAGLYEKLSGERPEERLVADAGSFIRKELCHSGLDDVQVPTVLLEIYRLMRSRNTDEAVRFLDQYSLGLDVVGPSASACYLANMQCQEDSQRARSRLQRLDNHWLIGSLIRLVRRLKGDVSFGSVEGLR